MDSLEVDGPHRDVLDLGLQVDVVTLGIVELGLYVQRFHHLQTSYRMLVGIGKGNGLSIKI